MYLSLVKNLVARLLLSVLLFVPFLVGAQSRPGPVPGPEGGSGSGGGSISYRLKNPLAFDTLQDFIVAILRVIIIIATPIVVIFIVLAGFKYVTARGNPAKIQEANKALLYAIIGGILVIGAVAIGEIIKNLVNAFAR